MSLKVSIITISYNASRTIEKTLSSVATQKYENIEHIIIDGGSQDNTIQVCEQYPHITTILSEPDKGVYDAFNKGIKLATGDIVGFLNADDVFYDNNSIHHIAQAFEISNSDIVYGNLDYIREDGKVVRNWISESYKPGLVKKAWMPAHPTFYCKKNVYDNFGSYNDSFIIAGDFELCLRFLEVNNVPSYYLNIKLIKMLTGGLSNNGLKSKFIIYKEELWAFKLNKISINPLFFFIYKLKKIKQYLSVF